MQKLTYAQKRIAHAPTVGQSMIKGESQTGKTTIGVARMLYLLESMGEKLLFITPQKASYKVAKQQLEKVKSRENMNLFESKSHLSQGTIYELSVLLDNLAQYYFEGNQYVYTEEISQSLLQMAIDEVKKLYPRLKCLKEHQLLQEEIKWIYAKGYIEEEDYLEADRVGCTMKLPKKGKSRVAIWLVKQYVEEALEKNGQMTTYQRDLMLLKHLRLDRKSGSYVHLIVDDAHLLTQVQIELLGLLRRDTTGEVLLLMDQNPESSRILGLARGTSYKKLGYDMTGKVRRLKGIKQRRNKPSKRVELTPLERFMQDPAAFVLEDQSVMVMSSDSLKHDDTKVQEEKVDALPWYMQTYKYINKLTGLETIFMQDTSAGETYMDEIRQEDMLSVPIYSDIAAGMPIEVVEENCGTFEIPRELLGYKKNTYMLHVQGDSMIGAGIEDGDYVVIQAGSVSNHEIAAVYYNGAITLKRIVQEDEHILLMSENAKYRPIRIEDGEFRAMGKLIGVLKSM